MQTECIQKPAKKKKNHHPQYTNYKEKHVFDKGSLHGDRKNLVMP